MAMTSGCRSLLLLQLFLLLTVTTGWSEETPSPPPIPGTLFHASGNVFALADSEYLNVSVSSSQSITVDLESVPQMVRMYIRSDTPATNTDLTLGGLLPSTKYYLYQDDFHNLTEFTTDASGTYSYTQDLSEPHIIYIQPRHSTRFLRDDSTGGDCASFGNWNGASKTCTMTTDLTETVQIDSNGITFDGNGHKLTGTGRSGVGVNMNLRSGVTIKNLQISQFWTGINASQSSYNHLTDNILTNNGNGINLNTKANYNTVSGNTSTGNNSGFYVHTSHDNILTGNLAVGNRVGIGTYESGNIAIIDNTISDNTAVGLNLGIWCPYPSVTDVCGGNSIYNNNFLNNVRQFAFYLTYWHYQHTSCSDAVMNLALPTGGNYWSNFDTPAEGCGDADADGVCDTPYLIPSGLASGYGFAGEQDNLPWSTRDGWKRPVDTAAPVVTPPADLNVEATGLSTAISIGTATATDNVGVVSIESDAPASFPIGTTVVTWTARDAAGNAGIAIQKITVRDTTAPTIAIDGIQEGAAYLVNSAPTATYSATDGASGMASQGASLTGGNANGVGIYTYTVTAADKAGNVATKSITYSVVYGFGGFLAPLNLGKPFKYGSTVPVKFSLTDSNGNFLSSAVATITAQKYANEVAAGDPIEVSPAGGANQGNLFRYDASANQYIFNLDTSGMSVGTWDLIVSLDDKTAKRSRISVK